MHDYSIDGHPKEKILYGLAFLAITAAPLLNEWATEVVQYLSVNAGWSAAPVTAIPVFGLFVGMYYLFNTYLWKLKWLRRFLLVPDLNGKWICNAETILKDGQPVEFKWSGEVTISQSWSKILIHLKTNSSNSKSVAASIFHEPGVGYKLLYEYSNSPDANQLDLNKHSGSAELLFSADCKEADGNYFTDRHRKTVGIMKIRRA